MNGCGYCPPPHIGCGGCTRRPPVSDRARRLTDRLFVHAARNDFYAAATRVDEVLEEVRAQAYEAGRAAASRERAA